MTSQPHVLTGDIDTTDTRELYRQGFVAGVLGAATIALWFLIVDTVNGRPLYTPTALGVALFQGGRGLESPDTLPISFNMVLAVTWLHGLIFVVIGGAVSRLLAWAEHTPNVGFGILLLFVFFEFGFLIAAMSLAQPVLGALDWSAILVGNLLAAASMALYFWRHHPHMKIEP